MQFDRFARAQIDLVDDRGRGGDDIDVEFALDPLTDDFEMEQAQKSAAEAEAERGGCFHVIGEARIIEAQFAHRLAQILETRGIDREESGKDHRLRRLEARQMLATPDASRR